MKIEWKSVFVTMAVSVLGYVIYKNFLQPYVAKLPIIGPYA